jgi:hypothetical protein
MRDRALAVGSLLYGAVADIARRLDAFDAAHEWTAEADG